jgi:hypothetical protein
MPTMEQIIQPFQGESVGPEAYVQPGQEGVAPALVQIGLIGGTQTFTGDLTFQQSTKLGAVHKEASSQSGVIQQVIANPSGNA